MNEHLKEFDALVDMADTYRHGRGIPEPPDEEGITRCIQVMLARQCIYANMRSIAPSYRILATPEYQDFFRKYFSAMGLEFHHDPRSGLVALRVPGAAPRYDQQSMRLKKDETAVLLALRVAYEEAFRNKQFNDLGTVEATTDDIYDKLTVIGGVEIESARLMDILFFLRKKGIVELGERDPVERVTPLTILPGIEVAVPSTYIECARMAAEAVPSAEGVENAAVGTTETPKENRSAEEAGDVRLDDEEQERI